MRLAARAWPSSPAPPPSLAGERPHGTRINQLGQAIDSPGGHWREPGQSGERGKPAPRTSLYRWSSWGGRPAVAEQRAAPAMVDSSEPVISLLQHLASTSTWPPRAPGLHEQGVTRSMPRTAERAVCVSPPRPPPLRHLAVYAARQMTRLEGSGVRNCGPQAHSVLAIALRGAISPRSGCIRCFWSRFRASNGAKAQPFTESCTEFHNQPVRVREASRDPTATATATIPKNRWLAVPSGPH